MTIPVVCNGEADTLPITGAKDSYFFSFCLPLNQESAQIRLLFSHKHPSTGSLLIIQRILLIEENFSSRFSDCLVLSRWCFSQPLGEAKSHGYGVMNRTHPEWADPINHEELLPKVTTLWINLELVAWHFTDHKLRIIDSSLLIHMVGGMK